MLLFTPVLNKDLYLLVCHPCFPNYFTTEAASISLITAPHVWTGPLVTRKTRVPLSKLPRAVLYSAAAQAGHAGPEHPPVHVGDLADPDLGKGEECFLMRNLVPPPITLHIMGLLTILNHL